MDNAIAYVFVFLMAVCFCCMIAGIINPRVAFFLKRKTRLRAAGAWFFLGLVCFIGIGVFAPNVPRKEVVITDTIDSKNKPNLQAIAEHTHDVPNNNVENKNQALTLASNVVISEPEISQKIENKSLPIATLTDESKFLTQKDSLKKTIKEKNISEQKQKVTPTAKTKSVATKTNYAIVGRKFSGNVKTFKLHNSTCRYYNCRDCVASFNTREEALEIGYTPCMKCGG